MKQIYFIEKDGTRRRGEMTQCGKCNQSFIRPSGGNRNYKFCSKKCRSDFRKKRVNLQCFNCKKSFERPISKLKVARHGFYFCCRACKEQSQSILGNCSAIRPSHYGTGDKSWLREYVRNKPGIYCVSCKESKNYLLMVHHMDGNHKNNNQDNLEIVCANCHVIRHLACENEEWFYDPHSLTPRDQLQIFYNLALGP